MSETDERIVALTTVDNPYDPIDQYDDWFAFDYQKGYCSDSYLARILHTSEELSEEQQKEDYERAINEIISFNPQLYKKVVKEGGGS